MWRSMLLTSSLFFLLLMSRTVRAEEPFRVYWADAGNGWPHPEGTGRIMRATIDGSRVEAIFTHGSEKPHGIGLDWRRRKVYWTSTPCKCITRSNLDGSDVEVILDWDLFEATLEDIVVDGIGKKIYWADQVMDKIRRANLDGTEIEDLVVIDATKGNSAVLGIDFDRHSNSVFWGDWRRGTIESYDLSTGSITVVRDNLDFVHGIDVDGVARLLYYVRINGISRISLDDGNEVALVGESSLSGVALSESPDRMFWDHYPPVTIPDIGWLRYSDLDGSNIEFLVETGLESPLHIEVLPEETDLTDLAAFLACAAAPGFPLGCGPSDFDDDGDVDLADFGRLQIAFTGPFD